MIIMLTPDEKKKYASGWTKRLKEKETKIKQNHKKALDKAIKIAEILKSKYGVEKVVLFGSIASGKFWEHSDIDIAVYGIDEERYMDIIWEASQLASPFKVDLVPIEKISDKLKRKIENEGMKL